jgi:hypothetical protein
LRAAGGAAGAESMALLVVAVAVRALWPDAIWFAEDQATHLESARAVLAGAWFTPGPQVGWSSFALGPLLNWVVALGLAVRDNPIDAVVLVAVLHGAAVVGWARVIRRVDPGAGRLAGWALALHPLSLPTGAALWHAVLILPTTLLFVWGIERWVQARSDAGFGLACVGAALMVQAHATTLLLLPLFALGWWQKAPVGRRGGAGLGIALVLVAPMVAHNVVSLARAHDLLSAFHHAGRSPSAAPYPMALWRALSLECVLDRVTPPGSGALRAVLFPALAVWVAVAALGAVVVGRRARGFRRGLLLGNLALPTIVVPLLPLGALFYYLDLTIPVRCWLFAAGVGALAARAGRVAAAGVTLFAFAVPVASHVANRAAARRDGFVRTELAATDLRMPWRAQARASSIPTLATMRAVGAALGTAGATSVDGPGALRGPWQAALAAGIHPWLPPATTPGQVAPSSLAPAGTRAFLVLHAREALAHPAAPGMIAGSFLVYPFVDQIKLTGEGPRWTLRFAEQSHAGPLAIQVVAEPDSGTLRAAVSAGRVRPFDEVDSPAGVVVWSTTLDQPTSEMDLERDGAPPRSLFGPPVFAAYAFRL